MTPFSNIVPLLAKVYQVYRKQPGFSDFFDIFDIGLPLAFLLDEDIVSDPSDEAVAYVNDTWKYFCEWLQVPDQEYYSLQEMFELSPIIEMREV